MQINTSRSLSACLYLLLPLLLQFRHVFAISKISAVGSKFFDEEGKQFFVKGIAYQLTPHDPLVDTEQCKRDASLMKKLGANAIRVYHVDPDGDHVDCMKAFADAGIYLFVDLDDFPTQIEQNHPSWNASQQKAFKATLDEFQRFDNTAGVFVGNEVLTMANGSAAAPYILSAARDIKEYRDSQNYRKIPVGYSAADIADLRPMLQNYLVCRSNETERLDFFALNAYEWCGPSTYKESGYGNLQAEADGYPVPIFFSEVGCNTHRPRDFQDLTAILGPEMSGTWSGAIVYEWIQELNDYGLITYGNASKQDQEDAEKSGKASLVLDGFSRRGTPTPVNPDFTNLQSRFETLTPTGVALSDYTKETGSITGPQCPGSTAGRWEVDPSSSLPSVGQQVATDTTTTAREKGDASATKTGSAAGATSSLPNSAGQTLGTPGSSSNNAFVLMLLALFGLGGFIGWWL
ncbi:hypothetical protein AJ80_02567 [Polytolypa hystricis UAMH7299]|uniref:1,3-beta-glucanosyltransferase n=1 Tax=Polytolypa hystricis (strain UAMH7299) TaxID=1447883 RepID=A0A2B7YPT9_POLH7|nr:hypothetical protein AJ80_02567 [Polytolypa hystricis UAMH7299]